MLRISLPVAVDVSTLSLPIDSITKPAPLADVSSRLTLPDQRTIARQLKDMGYVKHTIGSKHQGPKIGGKERCIYYRPDRVSPSDFMPLLKRRVTSGPF